jgi:hypothetical protein
LLFDCLAGTTDNIYLDTAYCQPEPELDWNAENLRYLARDAARLAVVHQHLAELEDYVVAHPRRAARRLWRWWRKAASAPVTKRPVPDVLGRPLVEILGAELPDC